MIYFKTKIFTSKNHHCSLNILFIFFLFNLTLIKSQSNNYTGNWITQNSEMMIISDSKFGVNYLSNLDIDRQISSIKISNDTISFRQHNSATGVYDTYNKSSYNKVDQPKKSVLFKNLDRSDRYDFKILRNSDSILILKPISEFSKTFFNNAETLKFVKQDFNVDSTLKFKKIIFSVKAFKTIEIDKNQNIKVNGRLITEKLDNKTYNNLINCIKTSNIRSWNFMEKTGSSHLPEINMTIFYNNKKLTYKSLEPALITKNLVQILFAINAIQYE